MTRIAARVKIIHATQFTETPEYLRKLGALRVMAVAKFCISMLPPFALAWSGLALYGSMAWPGRLATILKPFSRFDREAVAQRAEGGRFQRCIGC